MTEQREAWTYEGRFWVAPGGTVHAVSDCSSHEEWANDVMASSLESLLSEGWIRIQAFRYLLIDYQPAVTHAQADSLLEFFFDRDNLIPYHRIVVERHCHDLQEFPAGENRAAYAFACTGSTTGTEDDSP